MADAAMRYKREWSFPPWLSDELEKVIEHPCLHVCSGTSKLGDLRVDLYTPEADMKADMFHLPFKDESWHCVLIDPPWHLAANKRPALLWELRRVLAPGGLLLLDSFWIPNIPRLDLDRIAISRPKVFWANCSAVGFYRKRQTTLGVG